jgi:glycosyltransferase involved in cell wall biosynthesis
MDVFKNRTVLYFAPELPALSATFVYNEIFRLKELGGDIRLASVHQPSAAVDQHTQQKLGPVFILYTTSLILRILNLVKIVVTHPVNFTKAAGWLLRDIHALGKPNRITLGLIFRFVAAATLAELILRQKIDHVHVHFAHIPTDIAMYATRMADITFSVTSHANDIFERGWLLKEKIERSKFFITISEFNKRYLTKITPALENKISVVYCGVDTREFITTTKTKNDLFTFGFLGRLVEKKGAEFLILAAKELSHKRTDFCINIVGDGPLLEPLQQMINQLDINKLVNLHGAMANNDVPRWLSALDAFVLPSVKDKNGDMDGIPVSLMEAMASGVPVLSTDISGIKELVINQQTGLLIEPANTSALATSMARLLDMPKQGLEALSQQASNHIQNNFNQQTNAKEIAGRIAK